ncbi:MAG: hypothetical protein AAFV53_09900 [Myxococcota bacterium]
MRSNGIIALALLVACGGEQNFTTGNDGNTNDLGETKMAYSPDVLLITDIDVDSGVSRSVPIELRNVGTNDLRVDRFTISNSGGVFLVVLQQEYEDSLISPEDSEEFLVTAQPTTELAGGGVYGELRISTNDPEFRDLRVPLCAYPLGWKDATPCSADLLDQQADTAAE